jgi:hypothetical protein
MANVVASVKQKGSQGQLTQTYWHFITHMDGRTECGLSPADQIGIRSRHRATKQKMCMDCVVGATEAKPEEFMPEPLLPRGYRNREGAARYVTEALDKLFGRQ